MADIGLTSALRITAAITAWLALVTVAVECHLSHRPARVPELSRAQTGFALRACRRRYTALLRASRHGPLVHALCGDPRTRVVSMHIELVIP